MGRFKFPVRAVQVNGSTYHVRSITSRQFEAIMATKRGKDDEAAGIEILRLCVLYGLSDADGNRVMPDEALDEVLDMPLGIQRTLGEAVAELSGLTGDDLGN